MYLIENDFKIFKDYFISIFKGFIDKINLKKCKKTNSFTQTILMPEGAKYIGSEYLGQKRVNNYISTIYKIDRDEEDSCFYTSYVYKKGMTQVLITDSWENLSKLYSKIDSIKSPYVVEVDGLINKGGGLKNGKKTRFGRKRF